MTGAGLLLSFVVKVLQRDFEIWWKHFRLTDHKDGRELSYPLLHYILGGSRNIFINVTKSILSLYKTLLVNKKELSMPRKLLARVALLFSHSDSREDSGLLQCGEKVSLVK